MPHGQPLGYHCAATHGVTPRQFPVNGALNLNLGFWVSQTTLMAEINDGGGGGCQKIARAPGTPFDILTDMERPFMLYVINKLL